MTRSPTRTAVAAVAAIAVAAALLLASTSTLAHPEYAGRIPNGDRVRRNGVPWPAVGHSGPRHGGGAAGEAGDAEGVSSINAFGFAFMEAGGRWTAELCRADSDGDGQSNGLELGDPDCTGAATRAHDISHPGYADSMTLAGLAALPQAAVGDTGSDRRGDALHGGGAVVGGGLGDHGDQGDDAEGRMDAAVEAEINAREAMAQDASDLPSSGPGHGRTRTRSLTAPAPPTTPTATPRPTMPAVLGGALRIDVNWTDGVVCWTLEGPASGNNRYAAVSVAASRMNGLGVACKQPTALDAVGSCTAITTSSFSATPRVDPALVVSEAFGNGAWFRVSVALNASLMGIQPGTLRVIFAIGNWEPINRVPQQHSRADRNFTFITFAEQSTSTLAPTTTTSTATTVATSMTTTTTTPMTPVTSGRTTGPTTGTTGTVTSSGGSGSGSGSGSGGVTPSLTSLTPPTPTRRGPRPSPPTRRRRPQPRTSTPSPPCSTSTPSRGRAAC